MTWEMWLLTAGVVAIAACIVIIALVIYAFITGRYKGDTGTHPRIGKSEANLKQRKLPPQAPPKERAVGESRRRAPQSKHLGNTAVATKRRGR